MSTSATLGGFPLLASAPVSWTLSSGVTPHTATFDMTPDHAKQLISRAASTNLPVELRIESGEHTQVFSDLYIIGKTPSMVPYIDKVVVADRRIWWRYGHIGPRRYNWRRRVGYKRLISIDSPQTIQDVADDVWYAPWSLKTFDRFDDGYAPSSEKWTALDMIINVIGAVLQTEKDYNGVNVPWHGLDKEHELKQLPVENLLLDDSADQALSRALAYLPEMSVYITASGSVCFYSRASGKEKGIARSAGAPKVGGGLVQAISNRFRRPRKIHVLFTREVELRFDFAEKDEVESKYDPKRSTLNKIQKSQRRVENVLPLPDFKLNDITQGTWVEFNKAVSMWNAEEWPSIAGGTIKNLKYFRRAMVPFIDMWSNLNLAGLVRSNADWLSRVNSIQSNFRRTFKIVPAWWDRILSVKAHRVALIDAETGSLAPSLVYSDFCRMNNQRSQFRDAYASKENPDGSRGGKVFYCINGSAYPVNKSANPNGEPCEEYPFSKLDSQIASDAKITIADQEQGVFRVEYVPDIFHAYDVILPGLLEMSDTGYTGGDLPLEAGPSLDLKDRAKGIAFDAVAGIRKGASGKIQTSRPQLKANHKLAVVLTAIPATWNSFDSGGKEVDQQLEKITIDPSDPENSDLLDMVHPNVKKDIKDALGPDLYIRVGAGVEVARIGWSDDKYQEIEKIFGVYNGAGELWDDSPPNLGDLVINRGSNAQGASLNQIALAVAARIYSGHVDHLQGALKGDLVPNLHPDGWLDSVTYSLETSGEGSVSVDMPETVTQFDLMSFMDDSARATIMKLAQP